MQPVAPHAHLLRVVHQIPHRVRLRPRSGRWTPHQRDRVAMALQRTAGVQSFRISEHSLTVHHSAPLHAVIDAVQGAVARVAATRPRKASPQDQRQRGAARRLLACAVVSLAVALLPEPVAPAMILLRLLACGITAAVRYQAEAEAQAQRYAFTRLLDALAFVAGPARAENIVRALWKHCAAAVLRRWAEARLRQMLA